MLKDQTICQFLNIKVETGRPFRCYHGGYEVYYEYSDGTWWKKGYDAKGNQTHLESSDGYWRKHEYDSNGNQTYYEDFKGYWWKCEYDSKGNQTYYENSKGFWVKTERDANGKMIYREDSNGYIYDKRPKEIALDDIAKKFGIPVDHLKIKK